MCLCAEEPRRWSPEEVELTEAVGRQLGAVVERLRLLEEERQRSRQLILVARIAHQAVTQLDPDALLQETAHALHEIFGYPDVLIALVDPEQKMLIRKAWAGVYRRTSLKEDRRPITDRGILDWVVVHGQTVLANDVSKDPRYLAFSPDTQAELCVPIKDGERVIGCINVESDRLNAFDPADAMALEALANELAVALRNAELFAQTQRKIKELTALNEVGRALMTTLELDELLEVIYRQVRAIMETEAFFIALYDAQANELDYRIRVDRDIREPQERRTPGGLTGQIVRSGRPILIRDWERERGQYPQPRLWGTMEIPASWLGVPLKIGERVVGVISVQAYRPHAYDEGHLELLSTLAGMAAVAIENAQLYKQLEEAYIEAILALANAIAARHAYTADHSVRLTEWAVATAKELGCAEEEIEALRWAALLHDLGKIGVPDELLLKPGPLTEEEWTVMKRHPEIGARIVAPVKKLSAAASIIRAHHERWDGTGYPDGLKGEEIPLGARILAVVDAYGAMIDERSYRPAKSPEEAVTELKRCAGTQFDPQVVEAFLRVLGHTG
jgi:putative nucleotidyltransferase with HDIG domain